ncbi:hypothetical protein E3J79_04295 [Candidatus Dependentiae bacterium]|nr:MAG: hypothetical protein E3J79_04295 [Candidatus Dependentiae bacterium]
MKLELALQEKDKKLKDLEETTQEALKNIKKNFEDTIQQLTDQVTRVEDEIKALKEKEELTQVKQELIKNNAIESKLSLNWINNFYLLIESLLLQI